MLKIEHLTKTYGEKKAVDDLSLHIEPGEIYGFIGHNGAGKTTTLKSVVGVLGGNVYLSFADTVRSFSGCGYGLAVFLPDGSAGDSAGNLRQCV